MNKFFDLARKWSTEISFAHYNAVALKANGKWHLQCALLFLRDRRPTPFEAFDLETESIRAGRYGLDLSPDEARNLIEKLSQSPCEFDFGDWKASLLPPEFVNSTNWKNWVSVTEHIAQNPRMPGALRLATLELNGNEYKGTPTLDELDLQLARHTHPYDNLAELIFELSLPVPAPPPLTKPRAEIVLFPPIELELAKSSLEEGKVTLGFSAPKTFDVKQLNVGLKLFENVSGAPERTTFDASRISWSTHEDSLNGSVTASFPNTRIAEALVSYKNEFVGRWWLRDAKRSLNNRLDIHRSIFPQNNFIDTFFNERDDFEGNICLLLSLFGLTCFHYGENSASRDMFDIVAFSDKRHVYLIECTTGRIDQRGKLLKLRDRFNPTKDRLNSLQPPPVAIVPVILTALPREETETDWPAATAFKIAVIGRQQIINMLQRIEFPPSAEEVYTSVLELIPSGKIETQV